MKRSNATLGLRLMLLMLCCMLAAGSALAADLGIVTGGKLHLRSGPSLDDGVIATYESGAHVQVEATENGWCRVMVSDGRTGYMQADYISIAKAGVIDNGNTFVNLRSAPSRDAKVIGQYNSGTVVTVLSESGAGWAYVDAQGRQGYMASSFIRPAAETDRPHPVSAPNTDDNVNPYELATNGDANITHQIGVSASEVFSEGPLAFTVFYPQLGIPAADDAIRAWIEEALADARELAEGADEDAQIELTTQYDAYLVEERYAGILETGYLGGNQFAHPSDLIFTVNVDTQTGALLGYRDIFGENSESAVLSLLHDRLSALQDNPVEGIEMDAGWLAYPLIMPEGVAIILPRAEFLASVWGTQSILLPYEALKAQGLLALEISGAGTRQAPAVSETAAPSSGARAIDPTRPMVALTFDDGPSDYTLKILGLLEKHGGRGTFCMVGNRIASYQDVVQKVAAQGSEIATHTWSHKQLTSISRDAIESQLRRSMDAITNITGEPVTVLRPPYGSVNKEVREVARALGLTVVNWSIDTEDWKTNSADATYKEIMRHVKNGSIILCHDVKSSTSVAMERVIPELVEKGYQLVTVSELLSFSETGGEPGVLYTHLDTDHMKP